MSILSKVTNTQLGAMVVAGYIGVICSYSVYKVKIQRDLRNLEFVTSSMEILKNYHSASAFLGDQIHQRNINQNYVTIDDKVAKIIIPVVGTKNKGNIYSWSSRLPDDSDQQWRVDQIDLHLKTGECWTFYRHPKASENHSLPPLTRPQDKQNVGNTVNNVISNLTQANTNTNNDSQSNSVESKS